MSLTGHTPSASPWPAVVQVFACEHRQHPGHRRSLRGIDARHRRMRMGAADESGVRNGLVEPHILDEVAAPREKALILPVAEYRLTDVHDSLLACLSL